MSATIHLTDYEIDILVAAAGDVGEPAASVLKHIIAQANDSPLFCSAYNKPVRYLNPRASTCQPFPLACNTCPMALYEEQ